MNKTVIKAAFVPYVAVAMLFSGIVPVRAENAGQQDIVSSRYPFLASGALTHRLSKDSCMFLSSPRNTARTPG